MPVGGAEEHCRSAELGGFPKLQVMGMPWDHGKEHGNYNLGFRVFRI